MVTGLLTGVAAGGVLIGYAHMYPLLGVMLAALLAYLVLIATGRIAPRVGPPGGLRASGTEMGVAA